MNDATSIVRKLIELLGAHVTSLAVLENAEVSTFIIETDNNQVFIGRDGETIRSLTAIARLIAEQKGLEHTFRIDIGGYEAGLKRKHEQTARMYAQRAVHFTGTVDIPSTDSFARRVMHAYIAEHYPSLKTHSEGEGKDRHLVISQK